MRKPYKIITKSVVEELTANSIELLGPRYDSTVLTLQGAGVLVRITHRSHFKGSWGDFTAFIDTDAATLNGNYKRLATLCQDWPKYYDTIEDAIAAVEKFMQEHSLFLGSFWKSEELSASPPASHSSLSFGGLR